jgi:hypothetical protein
MSTRMERVARRRRTRRVVLDVGLAVIGIVTLILVWLSMHD